MADFRLEASETNVASAAENAYRLVRGSHTGELFTADWQTALLLEGRVFSAAFGAMGATDITELTAGSDLDQPDFGISVPNGTTLIPLEIDMWAKVPLDADDSDAFLIVVADVAAAYAGDGTVVSVTPQAYNSKPGIASAATVFEDASGDITDPTTTAEILTAAQHQVGSMEATETGSVVSSLHATYRAGRLPRLLHGPAAIYGYGGGSDTVTWVGRAVWAEVPESRFA